MSQGYSMLGFVVIVIDYAAIGFGQRQASSSSHARSSRPRQSRSSMRCSSS